MRPGPRPCRARWRPAFSAAARSFSAAPRTPENFSLGLTSAPLAGEDLGKPPADRTMDDRAARIPFPGYGHPLHRAADPRVARLLAVADEMGLSGAHVAAARAAERAIAEKTGKSLVLNTSGAIPAVLLDAGFPLAGMKGVPILARTASLVAHLVEEQARARGVVLPEAAEAGVACGGAVPAGSTR